MKRIEEILKANLHEMGYGEGGKRLDISESVTAIKSLIKEKMPKMRTEPIPDPTVQLTNSDVLKQYIDCGYNRAIADINRIIEEL